ncbi:MAG: hypothetical protein ITD31_01120 [Nitrosospira sp.]|nr:hypothetical protein [Nitrosospira sp.]
MSRYGHTGFLAALLRAGQTNFAGPEAPTHPLRYTSVAIAVGEFHAVFGNAINARSLIAHHASIVVANNTPEASKLILNNLAFI